MRGSRDEVIYAEIVRHTQPPMRLLDIIKSSADHLEESGVPDALADAELLVLHAAGMERLRAYIDNPEIDRSLRSKINRLVKRRASGEPLQYIIGEVDFLGLQIRVGKGVSDTEAGD